MAGGVREEVGFERDRASGLESGDWGDSPKQVTCTGHSSVNKTAYQYLIRNESWHTSLLSSQGLVLK